MLVPTSVSSPFPRLKFAFNDQLLLSIFDEVVPHWGIFWCHSRRVWIEVTGMPVCLWCPENFERIAKLWGWHVRHDDRLEESKSFTTARVFIDCFQWEEVREWISIKVDDRTFKVYAKEVGAEVYNVQSHPDMAESSSVSVDETTMDSVAADSMEMQRPTLKGSKDLNLHNVSDPVIDAIINEKSDNDESNDFETRWDVLGFDPMIVEAQLTKNTDFGPPSNLDTMNRPFVTEPNKPCAHGLTSNDSCPYPPGYGPCTSECHVHHTLGRVSNSESVVRETPVCEGNLVTEELVSDHASDALKPTESISESSDTRYCINRERVGSLGDLYNYCEADGGGDDTLDDENESNDLNEGHAVTKKPSDVDAEAVNDTWVPGSCGEVASDTGGIDAILEADSVVARGAIGGMDGCVRDEGCSDETASDEIRYLINDDVFNASLFQDENDGVKENSEFESEGAVGEEWDSVEKEDSSVEILAAKEIWCRAGLYIGSSEEEEIHSKLVRQKKVEGKKRPDLRPKEQRQGKKLPCIQGKSFVTRKLMSETKKDTLDKSFVHRLWGSSNGIRWDYVEAVNTDGGILCVWSDGFFECEKVLKEVVKNSV
ncbi:hypothetical protein PIB30_023172 [Stylosanthes scabra]|uniref:DUF4283 domain-containing protein n=1 Tax=Stylosanthes scabra TaxID=79078 RepID=A0ABU6TBE2_9FABA|nr:hypothetical protein [Stylosanthes scabra]